MELGDLIKPEARHSGLEGQDEEAGAAGARREGSGLTGLDARDIFETLLQRERLGSTGVGRGIAIPHGRLPG